MARLRADQPLIPSVLDRLIDFEPDINREAPKSRSQVLREIKLSVRRDLENLLNTRTRCVPWPPGLTELKKSLVNYGVPDVTGANLGSPRDREDFCRNLEEVIRRHENRFRSISVVLLDNAEPLDRTLRFRIDALLEVDPAPEPVVFDSNLKLVNGVYEVKGGADE
jgi:type VI secretion system protein ImpF